MNDITPKEMVEWLNDVIEYCDAPDGAIAEAIKTKLIVMKAKADGSTALLLKAQQDLLSVQQCCIAKTIALQKLVDKLDAIFADDCYKGVFAIACLHDYEYQGPDCAAELEEAKKVLNPPEEKANEQ